MLTNVKTVINGRDILFLFFFTSFRHVDKRSLQFVTKDRIILNQTIRGKREQQLDS